MTRVMNFSPGPAALPLAALERAQEELLDFEGSGMSIMEQSHRGAVYAGVHAEAKSLVKELLAVPDSHEVLFLGGGASQQFAFVPMNFLRPGQAADYLVTGTWGEKALAEAQLVGDARAVANTKVDGKFRRVPKQEELSLNPNAAYVHLTTNNTVSGTQWHSVPDTGGVALVADMSSDIMSGAIDVSRFKLIYAGAQKNLGPSGLSVVIIDRDWAQAGRTDIPQILRYSTHIQADSLYNTPPSFSVYLLRNVLSEVKSAGGLEAVLLTNAEKARRLYEVIERRSDVYTCPIEEGSRSLMNVVFNLPTAEQEALFVERAGQAGLIGLKGHRSVGGIRASIYNAVSLRWVDALVDFMDGYSA